MGCLYAMMVDLTGKACLVVGGGRVGERKVAALLETGAKVTVVSPFVTVGLQEWIAQGRITHVPRVFQKDDGWAAVLVIAATDSREVNEWVYAQAVARDQWINVVDQPQLCNFTVPSLVRRGQLQIAISTGGASPSLAKKIRHQLEEEIGDEYGLYIELLHRCRLKIQQRVTDMHQRRQLLKELTSDMWLERCRTHPLTVQNLMEEWVERSILDEKINSGHPTK